MKDIGLSTDEMHEMEGASKFDKEASEVIRNLVTGQERWRDNLILFIP